MGGAKGQWGKKGDPRLTGEHLALSQGQPRPEGGDKTKASPKGCQIRPKADCGTKSGQEFSHARVKTIYGSSVALMPLLLPVKQCVSYNWMRHLVTYANNAGNGTELGQELGHARVSPSFLFIHVSSTLRCDTAVRGPRPRPLAHNQEGPRQGDHCQSHSRT